MTWVRLDDRFSQHPKVVAAGPLAMSMQVAALGYCNRELTDGFIPRSIARTLMDCDPEQGISVDANWIIRRLIETGIWVEVDGGYRIHDYLDYQPSKEDVLALREVRAEVGRKGGLKRGENLREANEANAKQIAKQNSSKPEANTQAKSNPVPVSRIPLPTSGPEPESLAGAQAREKPKRATQIPETWMPTEEDREWSEHHGFVNADRQRETPRFIRHHRSKGNVFKDISSAWRNWMERSREYGGARASPTANGRPNAPNAEDIYNYAQTLKEQTR